jgi:O-antigen/teichoic acid export membrane protein
LPAHHCPLSTELLSTPLFTSLQRRLAPLIATLGKRLGIDAKYFVKNSFIASLTYAATVCSGLVTGYLVARWFPSELYGGYKFAVSIVGTVALISIPGLGSALSRAIVRRKEKTPLRHTLRVNALLCLVGAGILLLCIPLLHFWGRQELWPLFVVASLVFLPNQIGSTFFSAVVTGTEKFSSSLRVTALSSLFIIPSVLLMLWLRPSPTILMALAVGIPALLYLWEVRKAWRKYPSEERSPEVIRYGVNLSLNTIPITLSGYLDSLLISAFFGLNTLAVFAVSILIPEQVKVWSKYLLPVSFARQAAGDDSAARRKKMSRIVGLATLLFGIGVFLYVALAPWFLPFLFPGYLGQMEDLILYSRLSAIILLATPGILFPQYMEARGMIKELRTCQWVSAAVFCAALLILIPFFGPIGAILARGLFRLTYVGYAWVLLVRTPVRKAG